MQVNWKRNTFVFIASQIISLFGSSLVQYAITWHITLTTQSGVYATISIVCGFVPMLLLSPFAGVWADRYDRKKLIILADGLIALCTLVLAVCFMLGYDYIWLLFVALALRGAGSAVQSPCISALLPDIVPTEQLTRVNGVNGSVQSLVMLASPMLSGALMGFIPLQNIFFIDVVTAALAIAVLLLFLKLPARKAKATEGPTNYFGELKQGFAYIGKSKWLKHFFIYVGLFNLMMGPASFLTPLQVTRFFGDDIWRLTAIEMAFAVGMMLGGLAIAAWGGFKNRVSTMTLAFVAMGVLVLLLGFPSIFWVYLLFMGVVGVTVPMFNTPATVMLQERVDPAYLGRVFSVLSMIGSTLMPLGMLVYGPLADIMDIEWLLRVSGVVILLGGLVLLTDRPLRAAGKRVFMPTGEGAPTNET